MSDTARITIDLALPDGTVVDDRLIQALEDLTAIMVVQAEDGLYTGGDPDAEDAEFILDWGVYGNAEKASFGSTVDIVEIDSASSVSRQVYIESGVYLPKHCIWCESGACHHLD